ncbi:TPA: LamG domain-containing protein [bacterium]|nr:LamG domain-containing protein [bacterium]
MFKKILTVVFMFTLTAFMYANLAESQIVTDGLVSYWTFDKADIDGKTVKDVIGKNNGNIVNQVEVVNGKVKQALLFAGGYVEVPDDPSIKPEQFSFQFWVNSNKDFGATSRFELVDNTGQVVIRNDERGDFGSNLAFHWSDGGAWYAINPAKVLSAKEWYNVAVTHDTSEAKIYLNGNLEKSLKAKFAWSGGEVGISIGAHKWASANFFDGMIDELLFYKKALTKAEVEKNFKASGLAVAPTDDRLPVCWANIKSLK